MLYVMLKNFILQDVHSKYFNVKISRLLSPYYNNDIPE